MSPRLHLFELEDQPWLPRTLRGFATDYLAVVQSRMKLHRPIVGVLGDVLAEAGTRQVVDLCSGSGGALLDIAAELRREGAPIEVVLTDRYPNPALGALPVGVRMHPEPVDARRVPPGLAGCRTMLNAFHHFGPEEALGVLRSAVAARQPIAIFEMAERRLPVILATVLVPVMVLVMTPLIRPFRWSRILLTYVIPLVPLVSFWDGLVSQLRAYTPSELADLADLADRAERADADPAGYTWKSGSVRQRGSPVRVTYLTGVPGRPPGDDPCRSSGSHS